MVVTIGETRGTISLGHQGENGATIITFDCSAFQELIPDGVPAVVYHRPATDSPYPVPVSGDGVLVHWTLSDVDTANAGGGSVEVQWRKDGVGVIAKSAVYKTYVWPSLPMPSTPPDPTIKGWVEQVLGAASIVLSHIGDTMDAAASALASAASATTSADEAKKAEVSAAASAKSAQTSAETAKSADTSATTSAKSAQTSAEAAKTSAIHSADSAGKSSEWAEEAHGAAASALHSAESAESAKQQLFSAVDSTLSRDGAPADAAAVGAVASRLDESIFEIESIFTKDESSNIVFDLADYRVGGSIEKKAYAAGEQIVINPNENYSYFIFDCEEDDVFDIYYRILQTSVNRTYAAFYGDDNIIKYAHNDSGTDGEHKTVNGLKAPKNATKFVFWTYGNANNYATHAKCTKHSISKIYDEDIINGVKSLGKTFGLPPYYEESWLYDRINQVKDASNILNGTCFGFITDMHFFANDKNSKNMLKAVLGKTTVNFAICGGDYPTNNGTMENLVESSDTILDYVRYCDNKVLPMHGNHDFAITTSSGVDSYDKSFAFNSIIRPIQNAINFVDGELYWSKDIGITRIICLDGFENYPTEENHNHTLGPWISQKQYDWLVNLLNTANGKKIIIVSHSPLNAKMSGYVGTHIALHNLLKAFKNRTAFTFSRSGTLYDGITYQIKVNADFTSTTGELVCVISGHSHIDESSIEDDILNISTTCDAHYKDDGYNATSGTTSEQAFDVFAIDYDKKTIKAIRFGRGSNREWAY